MPWSCPACGSPIPHHGSEGRPRFGVRYRCQVCRRELVMDRVTITLVEPPDEAIPANPTSSGQTWHLSRRG
jgi:hypothetical protein